MDLHLRLTTNRLWPDLKGCSASEMKEGGCTVAEMREAGHSLADLRKAKVSAREMLKGGATLPEIKKAGFIPNELKTKEKPPFDVAEMREAGWILSALKSLFSGKQLKEGGFDAKSFKAVSNRGKSVMPRDA